LEILVKTFEELKSKSKVPIGAIAPRLIDNRGNKDYFEKKNINSACAISKKTGRVYNNFGLESDVLQECPSLHACSLIPKSVFEDVGGYEENRYKGTYVREESDFYFQVKKRGYKLYFQSKAITYHKHVDSGGCRVNNLLANEYYLIRNYTLFTFKFYGIRSIYMIPFNILLIFLNTLKYIFRERGQ
jgi:GT2 family glycosyltransferase